MLVKNSLIPFNMYLCTYRINTVCAVLFSSNTHILVLYKLLNIIIIIITSISVQTQAMAKKHIGNGTFIHYIGIGSYCVVIK
jgi:hypothetical protein